jgi:hypothetical protein
MNEASEKELPQVDVVVNHNDVVLQNTGGEEQLLSTSMKKGEMEQNEDVNDMNEASEKELPQVDDIANHNDVVLQNTGGEEQLLSMNKGEMEQNEDDFKSLLSSSSNSETIRNYEAYNRMDGCSSDEDTKTDNDESNDDDLDMSENQYTVVNDDAFEFGDFTAACTENISHDSVDENDVKIEPEIPVTVYRSIPPLSEEKIEIIKKAMQSFPGPKTRSGADSIFQVISQAKIRIGDESNNTVSSHNNGSSITDQNVIESTDSDMSA